MFLLPFKCVTEMVTHTSTDKILKTVNEKKIKMHKIIILKLISMVRLWNSIGLWWRNSLSTWGSPGHWTCLTDRCGFGYWVCIYLLNEPVTCTLYCDNNTSINMWTQSLSKIHNLNPQTVVEEVFLQENDDYATFSKDGHFHEMWWSW